MENNKFKTKERCGVYFEKYDDVSFAERPKLYDKYFKDNLSFTPEMLDEYDYINKLKTSKIEILDDITALNPNGEVVAFAGLRFGERNKVDTEIMYVDNILYVTLRFSSLTLTHEDGRDLFFIMYNTHCVFFGKDEEHPDLLTIKLAFDMNDDKFEVYRRAKKKRFYKRIFFD